MNENGGGAVKGKLTGRVCMCGEKCGCALGSVSLNVSQR